MLPNQKELERGYRSYPNGYGITTASELRALTLLGRAMQQRGFGVTVTPFHTLPGPRSLHFNPDAAEILQVLSAAPEFAALDEALSPNVILSDRMAYPKSVMLPISFLKQLGRAYLWPDDTKLRVKSYYLDNVSKEIFGSLLHSRNLLSSLGHLKTLCLEVKSKANHPLRSHGLKPLNSDGIRELFVELVDRRIGSATMEGETASEFGKMQYLRLQRLLARQKQDNLKA